MPWLRKALIKIKQAERRLSMIEREKRKKSKQEIFCWAGQHSPFVTFSKLNRQSFDIFWWVTWHCGGQRFSSASTLWERILASHSSNFSHTSGVSVFGLRIRNQTRRVHNCRWQTRTCRIIKWTWKKSHISLLFSIPRFLRRKENQATIYRHKTWTKQEQKFGSWSQFPCFFGGSDL